MLEIMRGELGQRMSPLSRHYLHKEDSQRVSE